MQLSIVSYLDAESTERVRILQRQLAKVTGSRASLSSWSPHITVGDGVVVDEVQFESLLTDMAEIASKNHVFDVVASDFGSLDSRPIGVGEKSTPYVIYVDVAVSQDLTELVSMIREVTSNYSKWYQMPDPYLPHITLAFRDLDKEGYERGLDYLMAKTMTITSKINHIALVQKLEAADKEVARINLAGKL